MEKKEFTKELRECLEKNGFEYINRRYYRYTNDMIISIDVQKSNFDNGFYINYAFFVKELNCGSTHPQTNLGDIRGRFSYECNGKLIDLFSLDSINCDELHTILEQNINVVVNPVIEDGIMKYFDLFPQAKSAARIRLKQYLWGNNYDDI